MPGKLIDAIALPTITVVWIRSSIEVALAPAPILEERSLAGKGLGIGNRFTVFFFK